MAKQDKKQVKEITSMEENFTQWYTDICLKAEMVDYASVKGFMIMRPYGYAIWENMVNIMDGMFKKTGHVNVAMPLLIPESLLKKEGELVNGFAPEVAWVTSGGSDPLEERLAIRPTSETMFCDHWAHVLHSWRQLPMLYNQWCSVVRWEKTTRPFLRSREFWWQEGHTIHETAEEAIAETEQQLYCYVDFCRDALAIPVVTGRKTEKEKFAGAEATYTVEALMHDGKALQAGTSHFFGTNFAEAYGIQFLSKEGKLEYAQETSWGVSTRLIGAIIMTHGDDRGLRLPPQVAPIQVVVLPIAAHKPGVLEGAKVIADRLTAAGVRVKFDDRDTVSPGWKFNEWEMKGVPVRLEVGPRDLENNQVMVARRDTFEKFALPMDGLEGEIEALLASIQKTMFEQARDFRDEHTTEVHNYEELKAAVEGGFAKGMWCGDAACEEKLKADINATTRNMPFDQTPCGDTCCVCGKRATKLMYFAKAY